MPYQLRYGTSATVPPLVIAAVIGASGRWRRTISFHLPGAAGPSGQATGISGVW